MGLPIWKILGIGSFYVAHDAFPKSVSFSSRSFDFIQSLFFYCCAPSLIRIALNLKDSMSSPRAPHQANNTADTEPSEAPFEGFHMYSRRTRQHSKRQNPRCPEYLGSPTSAPSQAHEIRSPISSSNSMNDGRSIKSSSSLPTLPKTSFDEWNVKIGPKSLPRTFDVPNRKASSESERPARHGLEWIWVLEGNWVKHDNSESLPFLREKLTPKRLRRSFPMRKTNNVYQSNLQDTSSSPYGEYSVKFSVSTAANPDDRIIKRPSFLSPGLRGSYGTSLSSSKLLRGFQYMSPTYPHFRSPSGELEGLYCKTKRGIESGLTKKSKDVGQRINRYILLVSHNTIGCIQACPSFPQGICFKSHCNTQRRHKRFGPTPARRHSPKYALL